MSESEVRVRKMFAFLTVVSSRYTSSTNGEEVKLFRSATAKEWMLYVAQNDQKSTVTSVNNVLY